MCGSSFFGHYRRRPSLNSHLRKPVSEYRSCDVQVEQVEHVFEAHTIQRMELLVLSTLEWRMSVVTPFSYIDYFFHKLGISNLLLRALLSRVSEIVLKSVKGESSFSFVYHVFSLSLPLLFSR